MVPLDEVERLSDELLQESIEAQPALATKYGHVGLEDVMISFEVQQ